MAPSRRRSSRAPYARGPRCELLEPRALFAVAAGPSAPAPGQAHEPRLGAALFDSVTNHVPAADAGGGPTGYLLAATDTVLRLDASRSSDADGEPLAFDWDLNGDNDFTDAAGVTPEVPWARLQLLRAALHPASEVLVRVRVTDARGASAVSAPVKVWLSRPISALLAVEAASAHQGVLLALPDADRTGFAFDLRYAGYATIDESSLRDEEVRVTNLAGTLDVPATVVSVEHVATTAGRAEAVVTYRYAAPGAAADAADVGRYFVKVPVGSALDAVGNTTLGRSFEAAAKLELTPPTVALTHAPAPEADSVYELTVTYSDDTAIDPATLDDFLVELRRTGTYLGPHDVERVNAGVWVRERAQQPDGSWAVTYEIVKADVAGSLLFRDGTYSLWATSRAMDVVKDVSGNALPEVELKRFDVVLPRAAPDAIVSDLKVSLPKKNSQGKRGTATFRLSGFTQSQYLDHYPGVTTPPVDVTLYLTPHERPRSGDPVLATLPGVVPGSLAQPKTLRAGFRMPSGLAPGAYGVVAVADSGRAIAEPNEENNRERAFVLEVKEQYTHLVAVPGTLDDGVKRVRRGGVLSLVLELSNWGTVPARGTGTLTAVLTARAAGSAAASSAPNVELVHVQATVRVSAPAAPTQFDSGKGRVRVRFRVPRDWSVGPADAVITLALDAALAATDRGGEKTWQAQVEVV